jgi:hypothetical protein
LHHDLVVIRRWILNFVGIVDDSRQPPPEQLLDQVLERRLVHGGEQFAQPEQLEQLQKLQSLQVITKVNVVERERGNEVENEAASQVAHGNLANRLLRLVIVGLVNILH